MDKNIEINNQSNNQPNNKQNDEKENGEIQNQNDNKDLYDKNAKPFCQNDNKNSVEDFKRRLKVVNLQPRKSIDSLQRLQRLINSCRKFFIEYPSVKGRLASQLSSNFDEKIKALNASSDILIKFMGILYGDGNYQALDIISEKPSKESSPSNIAKSIEEIYAEKKAPYQFNPMVASYKGRMEVSNHTQRFDTDGSILDESNKDTSKIVLIKSKITTAKNNDNGKTSVDQNSTNAIMAAVLGNKAKQNDASLEEGKINNIRQNYSLFLDYLDQSLPVETIYINRCFCANSLLSFHNIKNLLYMLNLLLENDHLKYINKEILMNFVNDTCEIIVSISSLYMGQKWWMRLCC